VNRYPGDCPTNYARVKFCGTSPRQQRVRGHRLGNASSTCRASASHSFSRIRLSPPAQSTHRPSTFWNRAHNITRQDVTTKNSRPITAHARRSLISSPPPTNSHIEPHNHKTNIISKFHLRPLPIPSRTRLQDPQTHNHTRPQR
jgi:hypothetical protein